MGLFITPTKYHFSLLRKTQVEHPVTEMISSVDLIEEQIHVAMGGKLRYKQVSRKRYFQRKNKNKYSP